MKNQLMIAAGLVASLAGAAHAKSAPAQKAVPKTAVPAQPSLFNNPNAKVFASGTGGQVAYLLTTSPIFGAYNGSGTTAVGQQATVQVEVTDPNGYYKGGTKTAPKTINGALAAQVTTPPANQPSYLPSWQTNHATTSPTGSTMTLTRVGNSDVYRGAGTLSATASATATAPPWLGNLSIAFVGKNQSWNSRFGANYPLQ